MLEVVNKILISGALKLLCRPSGGGYPGGGQHHCAGDVSAPPAGLALHPVLRLQALQWEEEEEEEEEGPQPARLLHVIAAPPLFSPDQDPSADLTRPKQTKKRIKLWNNGEHFHVSGSATSPGSTSEDFHLKAR